MKKFITLLFLLVAFVTANAQTNIPLTNGDFSSGTTLATGTSPWTTEVPGYTITQAGTAVLTTASSGVISNELKLVGTSSATQGDILVNTTPIDISSYGNTTTLLYSYQMKLGTASSQVAPYNVNIILTDANGVIVTTACSASAVVKVQGNFRTGAVGVYQTVSCQLTLKANDGTNPLSALDASFASLTVQLGKMIGNNITCDNFALTASGAAASTTISAASNTALSYEVGYGPSDESTFTVEGVNLTNGVVVTPGSNLEISATSGSGFSSTPITLPQVSGTVATTTIYTRLIAGGGVGSLGANATRLITVSTATLGVANKTIQFTGTVTGIAISGSTGSTLTYIQGAGPSAEQSFNLQGAGLTADVVVTPGANIEISTTTGTGFASTPITLTQTGGAVAATPIYARLKSGLAVNTYADATTEVIASTTGFTSKSLQFTGTVDIGTGISNNNTSNLKILAANGSINITGVEAGKQIEIFNSVGQKVKSVNATEDNYISLIIKGIYFVKVDSFVQKVILK
jgi:hypothetical protein